MVEKKNEKQCDAAEDQDRRGFIQGAACVIGGVASLVPMAAAVRVVLDPLGREREAGSSGFTRLCKLGDLKPRIPQKFVIISDKKDKWSSYKNVPIGAVHVLLQDSIKSEPGAKEEVRSEELDGDKNATDSNGSEAGGTKATEESLGAKPKVIAFSTICPHLGCSVDYRKDEKDFFCPCHNSKFGVSEGEEGKPLNDTPPRWLDELRIDEDKLKDKGEVWVEYKRFKTNTSERLEV